MGGGNIERLRELIALSFQRDMSLEKEVVYLLQAFLVERSKLGEGCRTIPPFRKSNLRES